VNVRRATSVTPVVINWEEGLRHYLLLAVRGMPGWLIAIFVVASPSVLAAQQTVLDIPYVNAGEPAQRLDLYLPAGRGFPTLIVVHGGGLTQEDKRDDSLPAVCRTVAAMGIGCASVNYRLGPGARWPAQPADVAAAVAWVRHGIAARGGDSTALVLLGHSSGCQLASVIGTDPRYLAAQRLDFSAVRGVVAMGCTLSPVLPAIADSVRLRAVFTTGALSTFGSLEAFLDADPTTHAGPSTPPFLVLIAEAEQINPPILERARAFAARMTALGRPVEIDVLPGRRHYTALSQMADPGDPTLKLLLDFFRRSTRLP
jgi:acetyl esterase/lipase